MKVQAINQIPSTLKSSEHNYLLHSLLVVSSVTPTAFGKKVVIIIPLVSNIFKPMLYEKETEKIALLYKNYDKNSYLKCTLNVLLSSPALTETSTP
jgi:hypothetical protein